MATLALTPLELLRGLNRVVAALDRCTTPAQLASALVTDGLEPLTANAVLLVAPPAGRPDPTLIAVAGATGPCAALRDVMTAELLAQAIASDDDVIPAGERLVLRPLRTGGELVGLLAAGFAQPLPLADEAVTCYLGTVVDQAAHHLAVLLERRRTLDRATRLALALDAGNLGTFDWDPDTDLLTWSTNLCAAFGVPDTMTNCPMEDFFRTVHRDDHARVRGALERARLVTGEYSAEFRLRAHPGTWISARGKFLPAASPVPGAGARRDAGRMVGTAFDATAKRNQADQLTLQLEQLPDAFMMVDHGLRFLYVNAATEALLQRDRGTMLGRHVEEVIPTFAKSDWGRKYLVAFGDSTAHSFEHYAPEIDRWFEVRVYPGPDGFSCYSTDITVRKKAQADRDRLASARRHALERTLAVQAVTDALAEALTVDQVTDVMARQLCLALGAEGLVVGLKEHQDLIRVVRAEGTDDVVVGEVVRAGDGPPSTMLLGPALLERRTVIASDDRGSGVALPLLASGRVVGAWQMTYPGRHALDEEETALLVTLSAHCAQALERARLYETERDTAIHLQRGLAPRELPVVPGLTLTARYLPDQEGTLVGGDFYDAIAFGDGSVGLLIGDVSGHGVGVASSMGLIRTALLAYAVEGHSPGEVIRRADAMLTELSADQLVTCFYGRLHLAGGSFVYSRAGHLPPLLVRRGGTGEFLEDAGGLPLGIGAIAIGPPEEAETSIGPGDVLLLFTDGLVESVERPVGDGLEELRVAADRLLSVPLPTVGRRASDVGVSAVLDGVVTGLLEEMLPPHRRDDVTVLAARPL